MTINFPSVPLDATIYTDPVTNISYRYSAITNSWAVVAGVGTVPVVGVQGPQGPQGLPGTATSQIVTYNTSSLIDLEFLNFSIPVAKIGILTEITLSIDSWVRLYRSAAQRDLDTRTVPGGTFQSLIDLGDGRPYAEVVSTGPDQTIVLNPLPTLIGDSGGMIYGRIQNQSGITTVINTSYKILKLEN